ncbi:MAG: hypothetical protein M3033_06950 [Acidobacteriota bacterium]|nr:hypothetical protein [Acidobacteriota bacterium]
MRKVFVQSLVLLFCSSFAFAQSSPTAFTLLKQKYSAVYWNSKSQIKGDFDYDGVADYALRGRKGAKLVVGVVKGAVNGKSKHWTLEFGEDGSQGGLCSVKNAVITVDDIDKDYVKFASDYLEADFAARLEKLPKNSKGITLSDGKCDSFHIFWDKKIKQFTWWRV